MKNAFNIEKVFTVNDFGLSGFIGVTGNLQKCFAQFFC